MARGLFVTFEGIDGVGKSTQIAHAKAYLESCGHRVVVMREPGGTKVGERIREVLLDPALDSMSPRAELLLYEAARAQVVDELITPALTAGTTVVCDRFYDSTTAYQGAGRGLDAAKIAELNMLATNNLKPDITFVLDLDPHISLARALKVAEADRLEQEGVRFMEKVRAGFLALAAHEPERVVVLDASGTPEHIATQVQQALRTRLNVQPHKAGV